MEASRPGVAGRVPGTASALLLGVQTLASLTAIAIVLSYVNNLG